MRTRLSFLAIARHAALAGRVACLPILLAVMSGAASGQTASPTFDGLRGAVQPGDRVYVMDTTGKEQQATIRSLASALLEVEIAGAARDLRPNDVRRIRVTRRDSPWNGVAIGAGIGAALGALNSTVGECTPSPGCVVSGTLGTAGLAAVVGWLIDRRVQKRVVVYDARKSAAAVKLDATPEESHAVTDASTTIVPGWFANALAREIDNSNTSTSLLNARSLMLQQPTGTRTRSWMGRHPMLFGTLVGLGGGFIIGTAHGGDDYANAEIYGLMVGGIGAGVGAATGAIVGLVTR